MDEYYRAIRLLPSWLAGPLGQLPAQTAAQIHELRFRTGCGAFVTLSGRQLPLQDLPECPLQLRECVLDQFQIEEIFHTLCGGAVHAHQTELAHGFLTTPSGCRVGVAGRYVDRDGQTVLQQVQGLNLRIARAVPVQLPDELLVQLKKHFIGMLLVGEPDSGKTTLLEKLLPALRSRGLKVGIIKHDGHDFEPDVPGTDSRRLREAIQESRVRHSSVVLDVDALTEDAQSLRLFVSPVSGRQYEGQAVGTSILISDVTELKKAEGIRSEFTANVSHELKTPLTAISGYAELIEHGMSGENTERFASEIHKNAARLLTLINDIIQLSQLDGGKKDVEYRDLDLFPLARECVDMLQMNAQKQNVTIRVQGGEAPVFADKQLMEELIYNLCDNAIRYNKKDGTVTVTAGIENGHTFLSVKDTGIGISAEHQERVFERFYRVDKSRSKATGGTGLGLAIVKHIVAQHGAKLTLESEQGKGTEIRVEFSEALKQHEIETAKQRQEVHAERSENGSSD